MTFHMNDREIKEKWLQKYKEEMNFHKEKMEQERQRKLKEEQDYLDRINRELEEEKLKKVEHKKMVIQDNMEEYYKHLANKQKEEIKNYEAKLSKENVSLNLGSEERLEKMKEYINQLSNKVDKNVDNYLNFAVNKEGERKIEGGIVEENNNKAGNGNEMARNDPSKDRKNEDYISNNLSQNKYGSDNLHNLSNNNNHSSNVYPQYDNKLDQIYGKNYLEYRNVLKRFDNYNKEQINDRLKTRENQLYEKKIMNYDRLKELERLQQLEMEDRLQKGNKQKMYKELLDDQAKFKEDIGVNISASQTPVIEGRNNNLNRSAIMNHPTGRNHVNYSEDFPANNGFQTGTNLNVNLNNSYNFTRKPEINPNPYKFRNYDLGYTILEHNTILNPVHNYKYNRYLYMNNNDSTTNRYSANGYTNSSRLQNVASHILK